MGERRGYRVTFFGADKNGPAGAAVKDLDGYDAETREALLAALVALAERPVQTSARHPGGFQRFEFALFDVGRNEMRYFVCPFQYHADEERIEIRRIFDIPL